MATAWATTFLVAVVLTIAGTPLLRRVAIASGFLDRPAARKSHATPVPYLGGVAIIAGALVGLLAGLLVGLRVDPRVAALVLGACAMGAIGLFDDRHTVHPGARLAAQVCVAVVAVAVGVRIHATGNAGFDVAFTVFWIVGITNALNLVDNMDGLAASTAAIASAAAFSLAALGGQIVVAGFTAGLTGACLGFLAFNVRPAAIYMGDAGSLFLGFAIAVATVEVDPALRPPSSLVVPLLLLAVPILDTTTVTVARLRRGRRVSEGGRDHLSHRLVARGLPSGVAVLVLAAVQAASGVAAVLAGRGVLSLTSAATFVAAMLLVLLGVCVTAPVYTTPVLGIPRHIRLGAALLIATTALFVAPSAVALLRARDALAEAASLTKVALQNSEDGKSKAAARAFARAADRFDSAARSLRGAPVSLGLGVPGLASNITAARTVSLVGRDLARAGERVSNAVDPDRLRIRGGVVPIRELERVTPELERAARKLRVERDKIAGLGLPYLLPQVDDAVGELTERLKGAADDAARAAEGARLLPAMVGGDRPRRYFLAIQNSAELRATGGFIGNWGELRADGGRLSLQRVRRITELNEAGSSERTLRAPSEFVRRYRRFEIEQTWQNVNMSPDFATVGRVIAGLYPQSGGQPVDGVIAVDPPGLAALLELTGPVAVDGWPEPLTRNNVVDITLRQAYERFSDRDRRADFLGDVADAVWQAFLNRDLPQPADLFRVLGRAVEEKHLLVYTERAKEQAFLDRVGVTGRLPIDRSDSLLLVNQNAAGNKVDYYLRRDLDLQVELAPVASGRPTGLVTRPDQRLPASRASVRERVRLRLANAAPASGLSLEVIGPFGPEFAPGENRTFVSLYTPFDFEQASLDGQSLGLESTTELGHRVYSQFVSIPAGTTRTLDVSLSGIARLGSGGWYELELGHQAARRPDRVHVQVTVPEGWRIAEADGLHRDDDRHASAEIKQRSDETVRVRVERVGLAGLWDRLRSG